jgi:hypothetical protein
MAADRPPKKPGDQNEWEIPPPPGGWGMGGTLFLIESDRYETQRRADEEAAEAQRAYREYLRSWEMSDYVSDIYENAEEENKIEKLPPAEREQVKEDLMQIPWRRKGLQMRKKAQARRRIGVAERIEGAPDSEADTQIMEEWDAAWRKYWKSRVGQPDKYEIARQKRELNERWFGSKAQEDENRMIQTAIQTEEDTRAQNRANKKQQRTARKHEQRSAIEDAKTIADRWTKELRYVSVDDPDYPVLSRHIANANARVDFLENQMAGDKTARHMKKDLKIIAMLKAPIIEEHDPSRYSDEDLYRAIKRRTRLYKDEILVGEIKKQNMRKPYYQAYQKQKRAIRAENIRQKILNWREIMKDEFRRANDIWDPGDYLREYD